MPLSPTQLEEVDGIVARFAGVDGALLPVLHAVQAAFGHVADEAVARIALGLNLSRAEVHGVTTFYHDFRRTPPGRHVVKLCRAEACQARGGVAFERWATSYVATAMNATSADGSVTLDAVYCLGLCAVGPNMLVDGVPRAGMTPDRAAPILDRLRA